MYKSSRSRPSPVSRLAAAFFAFALILPTHIAQPQSVSVTFTRVTVGAVATDGGDSSGAAWADYDHDGFIDLFVGNNSSANALYRNNGDGTFSKVVNGVTLDRGYGCAWGDFNNDGNVDLL